jgi:non-heme chloroperoxidase
MQGIISNALQQVPLRRDPTGTTMPYITAAGNTQIYFKDWGTGQPVVFSHGWPLCSDSWESQMLFLADNGYRVIAHDRRGHGRSNQPWQGNDMDTYADDLAALLNILNIQNACLVGFSTGGGEVARCIGRHGTERVSKAALISAVTPFMLQTPDNPEGIPKSVFDDIRAKALENRSQAYLDTAIPFFGMNLPGAKFSQGLINSFWHQGMLAGHKNTYDCIAAFSESDFREDLRKMTMPTLVVHGDADQIVPFEKSGKLAAGMLPNATLRVYAGAPHGLADTHKEQLNNDLLAFLLG